MKPPKRYARVSSPRSRARRRTLAARAGGLTMLVVLPAAGCTPPDGAFTIEGREPTREAGEAHYAIRLGDRPTLLFRPRFGLCDYAILHDESAGRYDNCGPGLGGVFAWPHLFDTETPPGRPIRLTVKGYRTAGHQDFKAVAGRFVAAERPGDPADALLATASIRVRVYRCSIDLVVRLPGPKPDWRLSRLILHRADGGSTRVRYATRPRPGWFTVEGPDASGAYRVHYEPQIGQMNPLGPTPVELQVVDEQGLMTTIRQEAGG